MRIGHIHDLSDQLESTIEVLQNLSKMIDPIKTKYYLEEAIDWNAFTEIISESFETLYIYLIDNFNDENDPCFGAKSLSSDYSTNRLTLKEAMSTVDMGVDGNDDETDDDDEIDDDTDGYDI